MSELKDGILNVNGFFISKDTKPEDFKKLSERDVEIQVSRRGHTFVKMLRPIFGQGFVGYVNVNYSARGGSPSVTIRPMVVDSITKQEDRVKIALYSSRKWLKSMLDVEPTSESTTAVSYEFSWGEISAGCWEDREYGLMGGYITIEYEG